MVVVRPGYLSQERREDQENGGMIINGLEGSTVELEKVSWSTKSLSSTWLRIKGRKNRKKERKKEDKIK